MYKRARKGIGYLPQETSIFRRLSVKDNLRAVLEMTEISKDEKSINLKAFSKSLTLCLLREIRAPIIRRRMQKSGDSKGAGA